MAPPVQIERPGRRQRRQLANFYFANELLRQGPTKRLSHDEARRIRANSPGCRNRFKTDEARGVSMLLPVPVTDEQAKAAQEANLATWIW